MCCPPYKIVTSFINFHATAIVGMWAALPKDCKRESNNMFQNLSVMALLSRNVIFKFANANIPPSQQLKFNLSHMIRPLDFTSYAIPLALNTMMTAFSILAKGRSPFHLSALEATFIKTSNPILCKQKEFIYNLKILHVSAEL